MKSNSLKFVYLISKNILIVLGTISIVFWLIFNGWEPSILSQTVKEINTNLFNNHALEIFGDTYGIVSLIAAIIGILTAIGWGLLKSKLGNALFYISIGLLFQFLGQLVALYYTFVLGVELPYPSWAELFYFTSIPIYIIGVVFLMSACGLTKDFFNKSINMLSFLVLITTFLSLDYILFLKDYDPSDYPNIAVMLDYAYPILQSIQVSLVIFTYFASLKQLGGKLKTPVIFLMLGLYAQYLGDTLYTYFIYQETWRQGDITDFLYLSSYLLLGISFIKFNKVYLELTSKKNATSSRQ